MNNLIIEQFKLEQKYKELEKEYNIISNIWSEKRRECHKEQGVTPWMIEEVNELQQKTFNLASLLDKYKILIKENQDIINKEKEISDIIEIEVPKIIHEVIEIIDDEVPKVKHEICSLDDIDEEVPVVSSNMSLLAAENRINKNNKKSKCTVKSLLAQKFEELKHITIINGWRN